MCWNQINIIRSKKRKKTIEGKLIDSTLHIYLPSHLSKSQETTYINNITKKMRKNQQKQQLTSDEQLKQRAEKLNSEYFNGHLDFSIKYVTNQHKKFGSCTPTTNTIRISDRVADYPVFVQNYLIIHELAHLIHPDHSKSFWKIVNTYPFVERAKGFLYAVDYLSKKR